MKLKIEYLILAAIILGLSLYLILQKPYRSQYRLPEVPEVSRKDISKIEISKKDSPIVLSKRDNGWQIATKGYPVDGNKVRNMLDIMEKLTLTALVSESKNYERYELNEDNRIIVKAWSGDELRREFEVGQVATSLRHTFVKLADDHRVYHARGDLRNRFDQTVETLVDRTVLSFDQGEIQEIRITRGEQSIVFGRKQISEEVTASQEAQTQSTQSPRAQTVWQSADGRKGDESKISPLLTILSNLSSEQYIGDRKKDDFTKPIYTIHLLGSKEYTLSIFAKRNKDVTNYPSISSENDYPFLLPEWLANNIMKYPSEPLETPNSS
jgi:hypothetical protein